MANYRVDVSLKNAEIKARFEARGAEAMFILSEQVAKDSNVYCPKDKGDLMDSVLLGSDFEKGKLYWNVIYARRLYHGDGYQFSKDENPLAQARWFEVAKKQRSKDWSEIVRKIVKGEL